MNNIKYAFSINQGLIGKPKSSVGFHNSNFENVPDCITDQEIMAILGEAGVAVAPVLREDGSRTGNNVLGLRLAMLDFDNTWSIDDAMQDDIYRQGSIGLYSTPSHGKIQPELAGAQLKGLPPEQITVLQDRVGLPMERFRMVFRLEHLLPVDDIADFFAGLFVCFPMADRSCGDRSRMFYGSPNATICHYNPNAIHLPQTVAQELVQVGASNRTTNDRSSNGMAVSAGLITPRGYQMVRSNVLIHLTKGRYADSDTLKRTMASGYAGRLPCFSPFRPDRSPSCFVQKDNDGHLYLFDSATQAKYMWF